MAASTKRRRTLRPSPDVRTDGASPPPAIRPLPGLAGAAGAVVVAMIVGDRLTAVLPPAYVVSVFLVAVLAAAAAFGLWSGIVAAIASFFAFNFFFVEPLYTFSVADPRDVFALGVFLAAAVLTGGLAGRLRETADAARTRADTLARLHGFAERVSATTGVDEIRALVARHLAACVGGAAVVVDRRGAPDACEAWPTPVTLDAAERRAVERIFAGSLPAGVSADTRFAFRPLVTADGIVAVVGLRPDAPAATTLDDTPGLAALLDQAAVALERARFAEERAAATAAAEEERLRSALLASISHDLRTPLATILGSVTSLRQLGDRMDPEDRADLLAAIEEETDRLSRLVADLLAMTRLEAGLDVRRDWIDVADAVAAAADHLRRVHSAHPVRLTRSPVATPVRGDATLLEQVVFNLGDNAAKASPAGAAIDLAVARDAEGVTVTIADHGRGLSPEEIERLFAPDGPDGERPAARSRGGLGLAIARRVVAAMGGTMAAESRGDGVAGTRVTLRLPTGPDPAAAEHEGRVE